MEMCFYKDTRVTSAEIVGQAGKSGAGEATGNSGKERGGT